MLQTGPLGTLFGQMTWSVYNIDNTIMIENQINCLLVDEDRGLWVGTNWGLYLKNGGEWQEFTAELPNPQVRSLSLDDNGNLWVGTLSGLSIKEGDSWTTYNNQNSILNNQINDVVFDRNNQAYIATINGLFKYDTDFSLVLDTSSLENSFINVRSLAVRGDSLVVGTVNGGLGYLYNDSMIWRNTSNSGINDNTAIDVAIDNNQNVWLAAPYGGLVSHLSNDSWLIYNTVESNQWPSNSLTSLLFDDDQFLFVGSNGAGFFRFYFNNGIPNTEKYNSNNSPLPSDYVLCLAKDNTDYWIGTEQGLVRWGTSVSISELEKNAFIKENNTLTFSENHNIDLYSITGQRVYSQNTSKVELNSFKSGVYIVVYNSIRKKIIVD